MQEYIHTYKKLQIRQTTFDKYDSLAKNHIYPSFIGKRLQDLETIDIQKVIREKSNFLAPATVREIHLVIHQALNQATREKLIPQNPADNVSLPRIEIKDIQPLSDDDLLRLINAAKYHRLFYALMLLIGTGIRRGELLGLRWQDVNFHNNTIAITRSYVKTNIGDIMQEPKTRSSIRVINVPEIIMLILAEHRSSIPSTKVMVVSQTNSEQPLSPRNFSRTFSEWCAAAGLTTRRVHDLRHTYASQLMSLNVPMKLAQAQLGHSDIKTTMHYSHFMNGIQQEASTKLNTKLNLLINPNDTLLGK